MIYACFNVVDAVSAQSIKIVNTFGGDADSTGGSDLFTFENQKDEDGNYKNEFGNKTRGNDFSTKVAVDAGYLAASDDTPKYGRILQSGFGAISNWAFGEENNISLKIA